MRTGFKAIFAVLAVTAIGVFLLVVYIANQFVDEVYVVGTANGFAIGDSKEEAYEKARRLFSDQRFFRLGKPGDPRRTMFTVYRTTREPSYDWQPFKFDAHDFPDIAAWDKWRIYPENTSLVSLTLTFSDGHLIRIHWHQQPFDLL